MTDARDWYRMTGYEVLAHWQSDAGRGLTAPAVEARRAQYGPNVLEEGARRSVAALLLAQFGDFMILVLLAAAVISGFVGDMADTLVILAIVALNGVIGFVQEYRAERAVAALKRLAAPTALVCRDGVAATRPAEELVPGDIVTLEAGAIVPADLRLLEAHALRVDEAMLTGESQPAEKIVAALNAPDLAAGESAIGASLHRGPRLVPVGESANATDLSTGRATKGSWASDSSRGPQPLPIADRRNMAYKGTTVVYGRGVGIVVASGMHTELGRIARLLHGGEELKTPLQQRLARFGRVIAVSVIALCAVLFAAGVVRGEPVVLMLLTAVSLAVAAIPEALPAVVTIALALGARKMVRHKALVRRLPAVETLGSVSVICADKTGTLTENRMRVERVYAAATSENVARVPPAEPWQTLFRALALSNDAQVADGNTAGDPTEVALCVAAAQAGYAKIELLRTRPRVAELPFDSERARMTTIHQEEFPPTPPPSEGEGERVEVVAYTKGAPESVLPLCRDQLTKGGVAALDAAAIHAEAERMAADGLRVLAVAYRHMAALPDQPTIEAIERDLTFLGLVGLMDPPRREAHEAVQLCRSAGITPVMITGDHPATARAIARRLGIIGDGDPVLSGPEFAHLSPEEFARAAGRVRVYARAAPEQKIEIVRALQARGQFVAMTGDGVNDAPALKRADIGVAMGITGTDVAKQSAHMILLDDNFATIVRAVREGRRIFDNIRKFVRYVMACNAGEIVTIFFAPFLGLPLPLLPVQILWINLVTDGLPGLALTLEPEERGVMQRPPRPPNENVFAHGLWQHIIWVGLLMGALCLATQSWAIRSGAHWQTMVFTVLTLSQMGQALAVRSERESLFRQGLGSNRALLGAVLLTVALQFALIYLPALNTVFHTQPLTAVEVAVCLLASSVVFLAVEFEKWLIRRGLLYAPIATGTRPT
jgi:Ca2+-transporting ATPase